MIGFSIFFCPFAFIEFSVLKITPNPHHDCNGTRLIHFVRNVPLIRERFLLFWVFNIYPSNARVTESLIYRSLDVLGYCYFTPSHLTQNNDHYSVVTTRRVFLKASWQWYYCKTAKKTPTTFVHQGFRAFFLNFSLYLYVSFCIHHLCHTFFSLIPPNP